MLLTDNTKDLPVEMVLQMSNRKCFVLTNRDRGHQLVINEFNYGVDHTNFILSQIKFLSIHMEKSL